MILSRLAARSPIVSSQVASATEGQASARFPPRPGEGVYRVARPSFVPVVCARV